MKDCVGGLVACQGLLGEMLVGLRQAFYLREPGVQSHCRMGGVLGIIFRIINGIRKIDKRLSCV